MQDNRPVVFGIAILAALLGGCTTPNVDAPRDLAGQAVDAQHADPAVNYGVDNSFGAIKQDKAQHIVAVRLGKTPPKVDS